MMQIIDLRRLAVKGSMSLLVGTAAFRMPSSCQHLAEVGFVKAFPEEVFLEKCLSTTKVPLLLCFVTPDLQA